MNDPIRRGTLEMTSAMLICGTIGWLVLLSGQPVLDVVFWRCVFGFAALLVACAVLGFLRRGSLGREAFLLALLSGCSSSATGCCCSHPTHGLRSPSVPRSTTSSRSCWWG